MADVVDGRRFFGGAQRVAQRQDVNGGADLQTLRARGQRGGDDHRGREHRAGGAEVELGEPDGVEAELFGGVGLGEGLVERIRLAVSLGTVKLVEEPQLH